MEPLATVEDLQKRLGFPLETAEDIALAEAALDDASALVRHYGLPWSAEACPPIVRRVVLRAAERVVRNPENFRMEMEGARQVQLPASLPVSGELTSEEIALVREAAGLTGIMSVPMVLPMSHSGTVMIGTDGEDIPYGTEGDGPVV